MLYRYFLGIYKKITKRSGFVTASIFLYFASTFLSLAIPSSIYQFEGNSQHLNISNHTLGSFTINLNERIIAPIAIHKNTLFISAGESNPQQGKVVKVDGTDGRIIWSTKLPNISMTEPIVTRHLIIVGMGGKRMFALNKGDSCRSPYMHGVLAVYRRTGHIAWEHSTRCEVMPTPAYFHHDILVPDGGGHFLALKAKTGHLLWQTSIGGWSAMSSPLLSHNQFYFGTDNSFTGKNYFYDINWKTQHVEWSKNYAHAQNLAEASPVLSHGIIYTAYMRTPPYSFFQIVNHLWDHDRMRYFTFQVVGMKAKSGATVFNKTIYVKKLPPGAWIHQRLLDEKYYWISWGIAAIRKAAHFLNVPIHFSHISDNDPKKAGIYDPPLTAWHRMIFVEPRLTHRLYALRDKTGRLLWSVDTGEDVSNPNVYNDKLYLVNSRSVLFTINPGDGTVLSKLPLSTGSPGPADVLISKKHLVVGGSSGAVVSMTRN
ncbi:PQQ-binding-like beta-propeller repeat protein [Acidithiobacillus montserratensis]|uniref:PQQ-binding-like beta-propeller repeat protein n=1 Tax=Acidithiobacillus montserratensis TaxID=2729135 RepID=A0ACD5HC74_9PROT|nr:PQQ-binding-like beta-propeller repeat protein [Acidithiobacillus montserratensis]MBU2748198.1 PQQ-binding-like beta-propeller repeat protein [Acidithiobacillus montserratensis]